MTKHGALSENEIQRRALHCYPIMVKALEKIRYMAAWELEAGDTLPQVRRRIYKAADAALNVAVGVTAVDAADVLTELERLHQAERREYDANPQKGES